MAEQPKHLWLQPGTRLHMIVHRVDRSSFPQYEPDRKHFEVWTSTDKRTGDSNTWHGTFMRLHPCGRIEQVHRDPHGVETAFDVM